VDNKPGHGLFCQHTVDKSNRNLTVVAWVESALFWPTPQVSSVTPPLEPRRCGGKLGRPGVERQRQLLPAPAHVVLARTKGTSGSMRRWQGSPQGDGGACSTS